MLQTNNEEPIRYSIKHAPASLLVASDKLDELLVSEEHVVAQLENNNPDDFETDDVYGEWKSRAMGALGHIRAERKFLEKWISAQSVSKPDSVTLVEGKTLIAKVVNTLLDSIEQSYTPMYSDKNPPPDQEKLESQLEIIERFHAEHVQVSLNLKKIARQYRIGEQTLKTLRRPLSDKIQIILQERDFLWKQNRVSIGIEDLFGAVLRLVERAESQGFVLNDQEQAVIRYMRKKRENNPKFGL